MKFILFLMFFTTTTSPGPKVESKATWTLQSTSQMEFATEDTCHAVGAQLIEEVLPVDNLTVRAYCICEATQAGQSCPADTIAATQTPRASAVARARAARPSSSSSVFALPLPTRSR